MLIIRVLQCEWGAQNDHEVSMAKVPALEVHAANGKHHDFQGRRPQVWFATFCEGKKDETVISFRVMRR